MKAFLCCALLFVTLYSLIVSRQSSGFLALNSPFSPVHLNIHFLSQPFSHENNINNRNRNTRFSFSMKLNWNAICLLKLKPSWQLVITEFWCVSQAQPIKLIYAYGTTDEISYHHAYRGSKEVNLLNHMPRNTVTNLNHFIATVDNVRIIINWWVRQMYREIIFFCLIHWPTKITHFVCYCFFFLQVTVPPTHTYYHCKVMKFPTLNTKHHIYLVIMSS